MSTTKSFFQKIKEFLYPIKYSKFNFVASLICWFIGALVSTYLVIFLKYITNAIEVNDWEKVKYHSIICFIVISVRFFIRTFYKIFPFWLIRDTHSSTYKDLMSVFFKWNNNEIEKIWTWRIISIIQKWLWSWTDLILEVSWSVSNRIFVTVIVFYTIWKVNIYVMFVWIIVLIFSILWWLIFYPKAIKWRRKCKIVDTEVDRIIILHIMNKFEIFQNNKQDEEIDRIFEKTMNGIIIK